MFLLMLKTITQSNHRINVVVIGDWWFDKCMNKINKNLSKKRVLVALPFILVGMFFAYKYVYIFSVRYQQNKVSDDLIQIQNKLSNKGIATEFEKSCGQDDGKYNSGAKHCGPSISYSKEMSKEEAVNNANTVIATLKDSGFTIKYDDTAIDDGQDNFKANTLYQTVRGNGLECALNIMNVNSDEPLPFMLDIGLYCGKNVTFPVY